MLIADEVVGDGLQEIASHLGIEIGDQAVREIIVSRSQHLIGVFHGRKQGIDGGTGSFRSLRKTGVSQFHALTSDHTSAHKGDCQKLFNFFHGTLGLEVYVKGKVVGLDQRVLSVR